jgi:hypothetical protein
MLKIEVVEIRGKCTMYKIEDKIIIAESKIGLEETSMLCMHVL